MASYPAHRPGARRAEQARGARSSGARKAAPAAGGKWAPAMALQRRAGNAALTRMLEDREEPAPATPDGAPDVPGTAVPVQRNVGLEIEDSNWHTVGENGELLPKGRPVVHRNYFQLQAEDPNHVEMVTDPPGMANRGDYSRMKTSMLRLEGELLSQQYRAGMAGRAARFRANRLEGGVSDAYLEPGPRWAPHLQVTAGVPLAGIPTFFQQLKGESVNVQTRKAEDVEGRLKDLLRLPAPATAPAPVAATTGASGGGDAPRPEYRAPSRELLGFTELLNHYLYEGANRQRAQFAKAVYAVMARTDFAASFRLLDAEERAAIAANLTEWVGLMVSSFAYNAAAGTQGTPADRVLGARIENAFGAGDDVRAGRVNTSREDWLRGMVHGHDLLSTDGRGSDPSRGHTEHDQLGWDVEVQNGSRWEPAVNESLEDLRQLMQGLGGLGGRTDRATYRDGGSNRDRVVPAVIVEVRQTTGVMPGAGGWVATADGVYGAVEAAITAAGAPTEVVVPEPDVEPAPDVRQDTRSEAIKRRVRNNASDLVLKARKLALRR
ncbi:hypothetical protein ACQPWY_08970 [Pseudonocardia xinjiangensis]|uniref:hypothetical protein n=1 Tax=Pseudonocardia xinjiangensis TaxID=75289 RepID=UPI003D8DBD06